MFKRIFLFLAVNFIVVLTISAIINLLHLQPYLSAYGLNYESLMIFCLLWGMLGAFISLMLSRKMAKWMLKVKILDFDSNHILVKMVKDLSRKAGLKQVPEVGVYTSPDANAFATGPSQRRSLVAVSSGLIDRMNEKELEAIVGHEISHIANGDMVTMTLIQGIVNAFVMFFARILAFALTRRGGNQRSSGGSFMSYYMFTILFEIFFMVLGSIVVSWFSRLREFRADRGGAQLSSKENMISALKTLKSTYVSPTAPKSKTLQALMISPTRKSSLAFLFATHPPLDLRIEKLQNQIP